MSDWYRNVPCVVRQCSDIHVGLVSKCAVCGQAVLTCTCRTGIENSVTVEVGGLCFKLSRFFSVKIHLN
jgi:hypothetical protein